MISFLISLLVLVLVVLVVRLAMDALTVPKNIQTVILLIVGLFVLLWVLKSMPIILGPWLR